MSRIPERKPFIGGESRSTGRVVDLTAPHGERVVARVHRAGRSDVEKAIAAAVDGFERSRRLAAFERAEVLSGMAERVRARAEEMAQVLALEAGKPLKAGRAEAERTVHTLETAAQESVRMGGEVIPLDVVPWGAGRFGLVRRFPLGPLAGITPFNFPLNLTAHKIAPALASGNSIVIKPASQTPSPAVLLAEIAAEAGAPPGVVNVVTASAEDAAPLVEDGRLKMLTFTGSGAVGWDLRRRAPRKRVTLELGGNAAAIVCAGTDLGFAAGRIVAGGFGYAGQSCISVQRVLVECSEYERFLEILVEKVRALRVGEPTDEETDVGPLISRAEAERAEAWIREALEGGARILTGGEREGAFIQPAVLVDCRPEMKVNCQEIFAPVLTVAPFEGLDEAIRQVNDSRYGLQAGIFTRDAEAAWRAFESIEVGGVIVNDVPTYRVDHMPYGGVKESGAGREGLRYAMEEMTEPRLMVWNRLE
jgi:acyl-CoA reductase-like NAD-dependent aldehyde dehydrogenase